MSAYFTVLPMGPKSDRTYRISHKKAHKPQETTFFKGNDTRHNLRKVYLFVLNTIKGRNASHNHSLHHTKVDQPSTFPMLIRYFKLFLRRPALRAGHDQRQVMGEAEVFWTWNLFQCAVEMWLTSLIQLWRGEKRLEQVRTFTDNCMSVRRDKAMGMRNENFALMAISVLRSRHENICQKLRSERSYCEFLVLDWPEDGEWWRKKQRTLSCIRHWIPVGHDEFM